LPIDHLDFATSIELHPKPNYDKSISEAHMLYHLNYAVALRCIGQLLQQQDIEIFEIKTDGSEFHLECGDPNPPYTEIIRLDYSIDKIKILDRQAQIRRGGSRPEVRFDSIPEMLRAIGEYVDAKRSHLRRLDGACLAHRPDLQLEYQTRAGEIVSETLALDWVHETAVRMYKKRARIANPVSMLTRGRTV